MNGNYFYIIIDRSGDTENVYFLNLVDEADLTAFVKRTYHDGYGLKTGNGSIASWADEDGLHITRGTSVRYARNAQVLSWEDATARIGELLEQGRFTTNVELAEAPGFERQQVAQSLWYLCQDMNDEARKQEWLPTIRENRKSGFPEDVARLEKLLEAPNIRQTIAAELDSFALHWRQNPSAMRFRVYKPDVMLQRVNELSIPRRSYPEGMTELPAVPSFITEDEIDATLSRGGSFEGGAGRIYSFWQQEHTPKEKADFLKHEYGTGGGNNKISHNFSSWEDHSSKGIVLRKPDAENVTLSWAKVAKRIDAMVAKDRYLTPEAKAAWEQAQTVVEAAPMPQPPSVQPLIPAVQKLTQYMSQLTGKDEQTLAAELRGVVFLDFDTSPGGTGIYRTADDFLSGNVREKLRKFEQALETLSTDDPRRTFAQANVEALKVAQTKDLEASEIDVRLGATWVDKNYIQQFMYELLDTPYHLKRAISVNFSEFTAEWNITGKSAVSYNDVPSSSQGAFLPSRSPLSMTPTPKPGKRSCLPKCGAVRCASSWEALSRWARV